MTSCVPWHDWKRLRGHKCNVDSRCDPSTKRTLVENHEIQIRSVIYSIVPNVNFLVLIIVTWFCKRSTLDDGYTLRNCLAFLQLFYKSISKQKGCGEPRLVPMVYKSLRTGVDWATTLAVATVFRGMVQFESAIYIQELLTVYTLLFKTTRSLYANMTQ